jgi:hypothetical protein
MNLPQLPADKANHFVYGALIALVVALTADPLTAMLVCGIAAAAKEARDLMTRRGTPDLFDFLCTLAGGLVVVLPSAFSRLGVNP